MISTVWALPNQFIPFIGNDFNLTVISAYPAVVTLDPQPSSPPSSQTPASAERAGSPGRSGPADPAAQPGPDFDVQPGPEIGRAHV